jgi:hypothetical protein
MERTMPRMPLIAATLLVAFATEAAAVSEAVKTACANDYMDNCATHRVGSEGLRQCMRKAGEKLSQKCVNALVTSGEVSKAEVVARKKALANP